VSHDCRSDTVVPQKDLDRAHPIPTLWRPVFRQIVRAFADGNYELSGVTGVEISADGATQVQRYIADYAETLVDLPEDTWRTSIAHWMDGHWDVLVDLWTEREGSSDMILSARVYERAEGTSVHVHAVYVP
jgi:hypothetical protein